MDKPKEPTLKMRVYLKLVEKGRAAPREVARDFPAHRSDTIRKTIRVLVVGGYVIAEDVGRTWKLAYSANPQKRLTENDGRGKSKASREALRLGWRATAASLRNLRNDAGLARPKPATAIEQAWGWGVNVPAVFRVVK